MSQLPREDLIKQPDDATEFPYKNVLMKKEEASNNDVSGIIFCGYI